MFQESCANPPSMCGLHRQTPTTLLTTLQALRTCTCPILEELDKINAAPPEFKVLQSDGP